MSSAVVSVFGYNVIMLCVLIYQISVNEVERVWITKFCLIQIPLVILNATFASAFFS
jgi:hypothetical protein